MIKIAVLVSGNGTNLQSIIDACKSGDVPGKVVLVVSSNKEAYALERARKEGIESVAVEREKFDSDENYSKEIMKYIDEKDTDLICLAGFLKKLDKVLIDKYRNRIMNIHPALLPKYGGKGMYGLKVHAAVLESGDEYTGCTVHFVDEIYDHGPVILQEMIPVEKEDTPEVLAQKVLEIEHRLYPEAIKLFESGEIAEKSEDQND